MALVTVITPAYNVAPFIAEAIESVIGQSISDWKLVVVDDGSTDQTVQIVERYCAKDPRICLITQENRGPAIARNVGAAMADSEFLSFLDADDFYEPTYIEAMTQALIKRPDLAFICCDAYSFYKEKKRGIRCSTTSPMTGPITLERVATREFQVFGSITLYRHWFETVGGYDAEMNAVEDLDLNIRLLAAGGTATYIDKPLVWYRRRPNSVSNNTFELARKNHRIYDRLKTTHPEVERKCREYQKRLEYSAYLYQAKKSLANKEFDSFSEHCKNALALRKNWKLRIVFTISRLSPTLARLASIIFK